MELMRSARYARYNPYFTMLMLGLTGSGILFVVLTSSYAMLRNQHTEWQLVTLPPIFSLSTLLILLSSITLHAANKSVAQEDYVAYRNRIGATFFLGLGFMVAQLVGWYLLDTSGVHLQGVVAGSFLYILSGLHVAHILLGLVVLYFAYSDARQNATYIDGFIQQLNPVKKARLRLLTIYWHFVDVLWLYLFFFFYVQQP